MLAGVRLDGAVMLLVGGAVLDGGKEFKGGALPIGAALLIGGAPKRWFGPLKELGVPPSCI